MPSFLSKFFFENWKRGLDFFLRTITSLPASAADVQSKTFVYCLDQSVDSQVHLIWKGGNFFSHFSVFRKTTPVAADRKRRGRGSEYIPFSFSSSLVFVRSILDRGRNFFPTLSPLRSKRSRRKEEEEEKTCCRRFRNREKLRRNSIVRLDIVLQMLKSHPNLR